MPEMFLFVSHFSEDRAAAVEIVDELERRGVPTPRNGRWAALSVLNMLRRLPADPTGRASRSCASNFRAWKRTSPVSLSELNAMNRQVGTSP
jgi:hypothetical protein